MGLDDAFNTGLGLALGSYDKPETNLQSDDPQEKKKKKKLSLKYDDHLFPSLTLGPSDGTHTYQSATKTDAERVCGAGESVDFHKQADSLSAASSSSNSSSVKRERESGGEEVEVEKVSSRVSDEDEEASPRKKLRLTKDQSAVLEDSFKEHATLNPKQKKDLARQLNLRPRQVEVWFQNRRARTKLKQTELDCELLKKCCDTLTEENKRLQKEIHDLKSLKLTAPFYMQLPAATLTMCPSCEKICSGGDGSNSTVPNFPIGPKPHLYYKYPFTHPSAAC